MDLDANTLKYLMFDMVFASFSTFGSSSVSYLAFIVDQISSDSGQ